MPDAAMAPDDAVTIAPLKQIPAASNGRDGTRSIVGKSAIHQMPRDRFGLIPGMRWAREYAFRAGDRAVIIAQVTGRRADGLALGCQACGFHAFRGDKVYRKGTNWKIARPDQAGRSALLPCWERAAGGCFEVKPAPPIYTWRSETSA